MIGRESKINNDVFFVCSLIEHIARQTKNHRTVVINAIGRSKLQHIYDLADIYHSENIDKVSDELINDCGIESGNFDNVMAAKYNVPTIWDIGKVYKRLVVNLVDYRNSADVIGLVIEVFNSWIVRKIEDFNSSMFYENPDYIFQSYLRGDVFDE